MAGGDFRSSAVASGGTLAKPAGTVVGDLLVAFFAPESGVPLPAGWVQRGYGHVMSRRVDGTEPATLFTGLAAASHGAVACYENALVATAGVTPVGQGGAISVPSVTSTAAIGGQRLVAVGTWKGSTDNLFVVRSEPTVIPPSNVAPRVSAGHQVVQSGNGVSQGARSAGMIADLSAVAQQATPALTFQPAPGANSFVVGTYGVAILVQPENSPPNAPLLTYPVAGASLDRAQTNRFSWEFSDQDAGDSQSAYELQIRSVAPGAAWTTTSKVGSPNNFREYPPAGIANGSFEWRVRTWDRYGYDGPFSAPEFFSVADRPPGPVITAPANGATITETETVLLWSTPDQDAVQVRVLTDEGGTPGTVVYDSLVRRPAEYRSAPIPLPANKVWRHIQVRSESSGLWSPWSSTRVYVDYATPPIPLVRVVPDATDDTRGAITVAAVLSPPAGGQPSVVAVDIRRWEVGDSGDGKPVVLRLTPPESDYVDWTVASDRDYEYEVVAYAASGATAVSLREGGGGASVEHAAFDPAYYDPQFYETTSGGNP